MSKKILFLGSKKIGLECLIYLNEHAQQLGCEVVGVLSNHRGNEIKRYCVNANIIMLDDLEALEKSDDFDIGISVQYHQILKKIHINKAKEIFVNLHMAPLPEYRGCNQFSFAIIDQAKEFGTTIHKLEEKIDAGAILYEKRFPISPNVWVEDLYDQTFCASLLLFKDSLDKIVRQDYTPIPQSELIETRGSSFHYRKEIETIKKIDLAWPKSKIERYIRATYHRQFSPPYIIIGNQKIFFASEELSDQA